MGQIPITKSFRILETGAVSINGNPEGRSCRIQLRDSLSHKPQWKFVSPKYRISGTKGWGRLSYHGAHIRVPRPYTLWWEDLIICGVNLTMGIHDLHIIYATRAAPTSEHERMRKLTISRGVSPPRLKRLFGNPIFPEVLIPWGVLIERLSQGYGAGWRYGPHWPCHFDTRDGTECLGQWFL